MNYFIRNYRTAVPGQRSSTLLFSVLVQCIDFFFHTRQNDMIKIHFSFWAQWLRLKAELLAAFCPDSASPKTARKTTLHKLFNNWSTKLKRTGQTFCPTTGGGWDFSFFHPWQHINWTEKIECFQNQPYVDSCFSKDAHKQQTIWIHSTGSSGLCQTAVNLSG